MSLTATDFFCGMGGSSTGLVEAGYDVKVAANHWGIAIETHSANHPETEHLCADIAQIDLRYLPKTDLLWASPICTELSPAGGRRKRGSQLDLFEEHGHVASAAFERTRVTFWEVIRACEIHRYKAVLIENVKEAADWELFDIWLAGMTALGYEHQFVSISAAHAWDDSNDPAPQWRDRLYIGFVYKGIKMPDLQPRPLAWCERCGENVSAVQWWKKGPGARRIGKYGAQYLYACPSGHEGAIEPYAAPASVAIDWTDLGTRIGDRESLGMRPLGAPTMKRIEYGVRMIGDPALVANGGNVWDSASGLSASGLGKTEVPKNYLRAWPIDASPTPAQVTAVQNGIAMSEKFVFSLTHGKDDHGRHFDPDGRPLPTSTVKRGEGLLMAEPFVTMLRRNGGSRPVSEPTQTFTGGGFHHGLTVPPGAFIAKQYGGQLDDKHAVKSVGVPMPPAVAAGAPTLVIPYRKGAKPHRADTTPFSTMSTVDTHTLVTPDSEPIVVEDCYFRMLKPREAANAQRFPRSYTIHGNKGEQQMQAGNAVPVNVARMLGARMAQAIS